MYQQLIAQIDSLPSRAKTQMNALYHQFYRGQRPTLAPYADLDFEKCHIHHSNGTITACFGCDSLHATEHRIRWLDNQHTVYGWCIWDAFFIAQLLQRPAVIHSQDAVSHQGFDIFFNGTEFDETSLWFTFPKDDGRAGKDLRACFCCRTKGFLSFENAKIFAEQQCCEVIDFKQMRVRTTQMTQALSSTSQPAYFC